MRHIKTTKGGRKVEYRIFESMNELIAEVRQVREDRVHNTLKRHSFTGRRFADWEACYRAVHEPWQEGMATLDRMMKDLNSAVLPTPKSRRRRSTFREDTGDELDYDRLRSGQPFWRTCARETTTGPSTITICVDIAANCTTSHENILWRGAAAITLTKILEAAGYRVELWACAYTERLWASGGSNGRRSSYDTDGGSFALLKATSDPLDEATLIAAVSGWCYRTVWFRSWVMGDMDTHVGLGHAIKPRAEDVDQVSRDENRILIAGAWSYRDAVDLIRSTLAKLATK